MRWQMDGVDNPITYLAATLVALGVIWRLLVRPAFRAYRRMKAFFNRIVDTLDRVEEHTKQLTPNSGSHVFDSIKRIENKLDKHIIGSDIHEQAQAAISADTVHVNIEKQS